MALTAEELELLDGDISDAVDPEKNLANDNLVNAAEAGNPDQYAADRQLGIQSGVSTEIASRNRPKLEKLKYLDELDLKALDETPTTQEWLKNDENAKIAYDDVAVLQQFEREGQRTWWEAGEKAFENFGETSLLGLGKAWDGIALAFLNEAQHGEGPGSVASMDRIREGMDLDPEQLERMEKWKAKDMANREKLIAERTESISKAEEQIARLTPKGMTVMEESIRGGMQMGADFVPGMLVSGLTRGKVNPTLGLMAGRVWGEGYSNAALEGKDHDVAMRYATVDMLIEVATERFPVKRLEGVVGDLGGKSVQSWMKRFMFEDIVGEQAAALGQTMNAYAHELDEELAQAKDWREMMDIQSRRQAVALISTVIGGGSIAGTVKGVDYLASREQRAMGKLMSDMNKRRGSEFDQERLDKYIHLSQSSKTNERAADLFEELTAKMTPDQEIFIDAAAIEQIDDIPGYLTEQLDGSGGTVSMPLSAFLKEFAMDEEKMAILRPHIKTTESFKNQTEIEEDDDGEFIQAILNKAAAAAETKSAAEAIHEQITESLIATGRLTPAEARQSATLVPAQVTVQYEYLKSIGYKNEDGSDVSLEQLYQDIGLEIAGPAVDVASEYMTQPATMMPPMTVVAEGEVQLEDGRTYHKDPAYPEYEMVMVDAALLEEISVDFIGPGPQFENQISNRIEQYDQFLEKVDRGTYFHPRTGEELKMPDTQLQVGNAHVQGPSRSGEGYISFGDGRHRARAMMEQGMKQIPITMSPDSVDALGQIIEAKGLAKPRVLKQQNFGNIAITETVLDEAGMPLDITESANDLWREQQQRQDNLDALRRCFNG